MKSLSILPCLLLSLPCLGQDQLLNLNDIPKDERKLLPVERVWPGSPGQAAICLWKDDLTAVISYTIDDNCAMNIDWWLNESAEREMKLTWFLVAAGIGETKPAINGDWKLWAKVREAGHALESHTMSHLSASKDLATWKGLDWEYGDSKKRIEENLPGNVVTCLAYPGGGQSHHNDNGVAAKYYISGRGTKGMLNGPQGLDYLSVNAMTKSNLGERPEKAFNNADLLLDPTAKAYRGWVVLIYHYIKEEEAESVANARKELDYYVKHRDQLWCGRYNDVARYAQERETATLEVTENTSARIALKLTDRMKDELYDFPLSVKVRVPDGWKSVKATQAGKPVATRPIEHKGGKYAMVDIIPDRGVTVLTP